MQKKLYFSLIIFIASISNAQWVKVGPQGGTVNSFTVNGSYIFAGTTGGGIFRSADTGKNWIQVNKGLIDTNVYALAHIGDTIFAATEIGGIFLSINNGISWNIERNGLDTNPITSFATIGNIIFAGSPSSTSINGNGGGIFKSIDYGKNWIRISSGLSDTDIVDLAVSGTTLFANADGYVNNTTGRVYRSDDSGRTWIQLIKTEILDNTVIGKSLLGCTLYSSGGSIRMFRSQDLGSSWVESDSGLPTSHHNYLDRVCSDGKLLFASNGTYLSQDSGISWSSMPQYIQYVNACAALGNNHFIGTTSGVYISTDNGNNWDPSNNGMYMFYLRPIQFKIFSDSKNLYAICDSGLLRSTDFGYSWTLFNNGLINSKSATAFGTFGDTMFISIRRTFRSIDRGLNWVATDTVGLPTDVNGTLGFYNFAKEGNYVFAGSPWGLFRTSDGGGSWYETDNGLGYNDGGASEAKSIQNIYVIGSNIFAGMHNGSIFVSIDHGTTWTKMLSSNSQYEYVNAFLYVNNVFLLSISNNGVLLSRSTDNGVSWSNTISGINNFNSVVAIGSYIFVTTNDTEKIALSTDRGANWVKANDGITESYTYGLAIAGEYIFASGTSSIWRRRLSDFGINGVQPLSSSSEISLSPNPTTGILSIRNAPENLTGISILNVLGQEVIQLATPHSADFTIDLSKLPAGMYYARFATEGSVEVRKIIKE